MNLLFMVLVNWLLFSIISSYNVKLRMLINDYTIQNIPFKDVDMLTSVFDLLVIKAMPA